MFPSILDFARGGYKSHASSFESLQPGCMNGVRVLLTGGTSGIGLAALKELVRLGAEVYVVTRDVKKGDDVKRSVMQELEADPSAAPSLGSIALEVADMALMHHVRELAVRMPPIDVLINNCGLLVPGDRQLTTEGLELTLATNLLSHFILTNLVTFRPAVDGGRRPRIVNVSSGGMYSTKVFPHDLQYMKPKAFDGTDAYARTKRAQVILTDLWSSILFKKFGAVVHCMHPGWVDTPGVATSLPTFKKWTTRFGMLRTPFEGADTIVWLVASMNLPNQTTGGSAIWLDREPHPVHMRESTKESEADRRDLWNNLAALAEDTLRKSGSSGSQIPVNDPLFLRL